MRPEGTKPGRKVSWPVLIALFLVPLLVAGSLLGLVGTRDDDNITAAVVNLDEPVTVDDQPVPLGRHLAGGLVGGATEHTVDGQDLPNISWVLSDEATTSMVAGVPSIPILTTSSWSCTSTRPPSTRRTCTAAAAPRAPATRAMS